MARGDNARTIPLGSLATAISQYFKPPSDRIRGVEVTDWFGPLQPVTPIAPRGTLPRQLQYNPGANLDYTPRSESALSAADLRSLADYPLARICIENVKDLIARMKITVRAKRKPTETAAAHAKRSQNDPIIDQLQQLVDQPNSEQTRQDFVRDLIEDMLVGDWSSILVQRAKKNVVSALYAIDGSTITRYINEQGFTPTPQEGPAYAQLWFGMPMVDLDTNQLIYGMRNRRRNGLYGYSPTEQVAKEIQIGSARLEFVFQYYSSGTVPDGLQIVPVGVDPEKVKESQDWITTDLAGRLAKRRGIRLLQGFTEKGEDQLIFPKEKLLADAFDDLHIRKVCFAYGTSPQRLLRMLNRATGQSNQESAEEEGTMPWIDWLIDRNYNWLIQRVMGLTEYEVTIDSEVETDPQKQAETDKIDTGGGLRTLNEARKDRGLDPLPQPEANEPMIVTATGPVFLSVELAADRAEQMGAAAAANMPEPDDSGPGPKKKPPTKKPPKKKATSGVY